MTGSLAKSSRRIHIKPTNGKKKWNREKTRQLFLEYLGTDDRIIRAQILEWICKEYIGLVNLVAGKFVNRGEPFDDLFQVGCIALIKAINGYDPNRGILFSTYATHTIWGEIKRHFRDKTLPMKFPRYAQELALYVIKILQEKSSDKLSTMDIQKISEELGEDKDNVYAAIILIKDLSILSLDFDMEYISDDNEEDYTLMNFLGLKDPGLEIVDNQLTIKKLFGSLEPRERMVLFLRFYKDFSQWQIAKILGCSRATVSRTKTKALKKMCECNRNY